MKMLQAVQRFLQGGFLFREMKPDQMPDRFPEKTGARYNSDADLFRKLFAEAQIIVITKFADIQQDIIQKGDPEGSPKAYLLMLIILYSFYAVQTQDCAKPDARDRIFSPSFSLNG